MTASSSKAQFICRKVRWLRGCTCEVFHELVTVIRQNAVRIQHGIEADRF